MAWRVITENGRITIRCDKDRRLGRFSQYFVSMWEWCSVLAHLKELTMRINDLTAAVATLQESEAKVRTLVQTQGQQISDLQAQIGQLGGLSAEDQAALDKAVTDINAVNSDLDTLVNPPAPTT